jgi:hypothetical protein
MKFKFGTDPEMFLKVGNKFVPACGLFPGTKDEPYELEKGAVQVDGLALEFNIHPAETSHEFNKNIETVLAQIDEMILKVDPKMKRVFKPYAEFDREVFDKLTEDQKRLGCDPDYNGKTGMINPRPSIQDEPFRTAAGHIHIGWTEGADVTDPTHFEDCRFVSNQIGNWGYFYPKYDDEFKRLKYYGMNYSFRPKPYGVEIRFPSNHWVNNAYGRNDAFNQVYYAMNQMAAA